MDKITILDYNSNRNILKGNKKMDFLAGRPGFYKITNDNVPQKAVTAILRIVFEEQHHKNIKRII